MVFLGEAGIALVFKQIQCFSIDIKRALYYHDASSGILRRSFFARLVLLFLFCEFWNTIPFRVPSGMVKPCRTGWGSVPEMQ